MAKTSSKRYERELVDVTIYVDLGMTWPQAREFAMFLDDKAPCGFHSGKLAKMILDLMKHRLYARELERVKSLAMMAEIRAGNILEACPF